MLDGFSLRDTRAYFRKRPALGAPDPDGWRGCEHASYFFLNDDVDAQQRIIDHLIVPYAKGDFHEDYLHEHADGRLSVFLKKDLVEIRLYGYVHVATRRRRPTIPSHPRRQRSQRYTRLRELCSFESVYYFPRSRTCNG